jgi:hypothetical protein
VDRKPSPSVRNVPCWTATYQLQTGQCIVVPQLILFSQGVEVLAINSPSSDRKIACWRVTHPLKKDIFPGGHQLKLFSQDSDLVDSKSISSIRTGPCWPTNHPLQSGKVSVGQLILFREKSVLVHKTHPCQTGQCPGGQQPILLTLDSVLL